MSKRPVKKSAPDDSSFRVLLCIFLMTCMMFAIRQLWPVSANDFIGLAESLPSDITAAQLQSETFRSKVYPDPPEGFLPVFQGRRTGQKRIALTIDDCNEAKNLQEIVFLIEQYNGKATIFPIGDNVSYLAPILKYAHQRGFEIENHTQSHSGLFNETDEDMTYQIWQQNYEVSKALGVNYQMHFLRPRGGDNRYDQRTHAYMRQMGYWGMAYWSQIGSGNTADVLMENMRQGDVILFHTTDQDLAVLRELLPRLHAEGWQMVTLNELFNLPANEQTPFTAQDEPPTLEEYARIPQTLKKNDFLHDVLLMQYRLTSLGYLNDKCDGCFGANTEQAVRTFQKDAGLAVTGQCDPETWDALFSE